MTKDQIKQHKIAAERLDQVKNRAFGFIKNNLGKVSEYKVSQFILSEFKKENLVAEKRYSLPIVAADKNTSLVHYFPQKNSSKIIKKNDLVLIDIWARINEKDAPFADITWMGYCGKNIPQDIKKIFKRVIQGRETALKLLRQNLKTKKLPKTKLIDKTVRDYFDKYGLENNFLHGLGHSLGINECHGKYFRFGKKSNAGLKKDILFTIEPGLYLKNNFGIRSEINCYITRDYGLIITSSVQKEIIKI
ncbi:MAG TPA: M24 family metallopeptidase [Candidatus Humimicrobiaceae bacterium]|nr:M24 family metallopeptidase [Candidatus Humimicrobiaceae bacterium]